MAKTGSQNSLLYKLDDAYITYKNLSNTNEQKIHNENLVSIAQLVRDTGRTKNIRNIIDVERTILRYELDFYGKNNLQSKTSIEQAIKELDGASKAFNIVHDKDKYQAVNDAHSVKDKDRMNGLPKDAFHSFTNSNKTRLGNRVRSIEASFEESLILKERYNNMKIAQQEYMKLQSKALDIPIPEKSKDRER